MGADMVTGFFWDEKTFWHSGGNYADILPVGGLVQPMVAGGLPETPESKRRFKNLIEVTGLAAQLDMRGAAVATGADLVRVHPQRYLDSFKTLSDAGGGELGHRTPFGPGGYEIAAQSAGLVVQAVRSVLSGELQNAYALTRPPGHHALPELPNGFCLFANIAIAIEAARSEGLAGRVAVIDWDVHHGNGTEAIFYDRDDVLTVSIHQDHNYPMDKGAADDRGTGAGEGFNLNIPLPPGSGHNSYLEAMERLALPAVRSFAPDVLIIACGFDAAAMDPLGRMMCHQATYKAMTTQVMELAAEVCDGRLVMAHEGGYSEVYVPFCGHEVLATMAESSITAPDPFGDTWFLRQPNAEFDEFVSGQIDRMAEAADL
jgi:acetoin utilization deacetylase AcuC-like enzyme